MRLHIYNTERKWSGNILILDHKSIPTTRRIYFKLHIQNSWFKPEKNKKFSFFKGQLPFWQNKNDSLKVLLIFENLNQSVSILRVGSSLTKRS